VEFEARTGQRILERYGMTETGMNTSNPYDGERRAGTVGMALPGVSVRLVDAKTGDIVVPGGIGIIEVKGDNVFSGYWQMPEKTKESFREDGYFITGDMAMEDKEGYITIVGRDKDLIISGGLNVYPKEVEDAINALPGVVESAVIGVPHPDFGEGVVAVVVQEGTNTAGDIKNGLSETLAAFKQPKEIIFMDHLPRNSMGKVQKANLRKEHAGLFRT
jgi:malonyl-CoA/methylmalonyl-CoA synthetase